MKLKNKKQRTELRLTKDLLCTYRMEQTWLDKDSLEKKLDILTCALGAHDVMGLIRLH